MLLDWLCIYLQSTPPLFEVALYSPNLDPIVVGSGIEILQKAGVGKENVDGFGGGNTTRVEEGRYLTKDNQENEEGEGKKTVIDPIEKSTEEDKKPFINVFPSSKLKIFASSSVGFPIGSITGFLPSSSSFSWLSLVKYLPSSAFFRLDSVTFTFFNIKLIKKFNNNYMQANNIYNQIHSMQSSCFSEVESIIRRYSDNPNLIAEVSNVLQKYYINIDKKYLYALNNNEDNGDNGKDQNDDGMDIDGDGSEDGDEDEEEDEENPNENYKDTRRKYFILLTKSLNYLSKINEYLPQKKNYQIHSIKKQRIDIQEYQYWILVEFSKKSSLKNSEVYNSIQNYKYHSREGYLKFFRLCGENFYL